MIYSLVIWLLDISLKIGGLFKPKFKKWNIDRAHHIKLIASLPESFANGRPVIWFHCASLGEFEQCRTIIETLHQKQAYFILLTFFSPSGYEVRKNYKQADLVIYLPVDFKKDMRLMVRKLKPSLFVGVKYDFWWNLFECLNESQVPKFFIAMKLAGKHYIFKGFAQKLLKTLGENASFYCQDDATTALLHQKIGNGSFIIKVGDPRVDSVLSREINEQTLMPFQKGIDVDRKYIVYGSIYLECLDIIGPFIQKNDADFIHILVPHDVSKNNVDQIIDKLNRKTVFLNEITGKNENTIVIVNEIGKLFDLYAIADLVYIGGGFNKNLHNTLEPARFGLPIFIGPKHKGFEEVESFLKLGIITEINDSLSFNNAILNVSETDRMMIKSKAANYFKENNQASFIIVNDIIAKIGLQ